MGENYWLIIGRKLIARKADLTYLRILKLAAGGLETDVAAALEILLTSGKNWDDQSVADLVQPTQRMIPELPANPINLSTYDQLLSLGVCHVSA